MKPFTFLISALAALPLALAAATPKQQMEAAQKQAAEHKKDLLMVFSASKWQEASQKLHAGVLDTEDFNKGIEKDFVKVVFDCPRQRSEAHTELLELSQNYRFRQIPSFILADHAGRPYAYTGGKKDSAESLEDLGNLHKIRVERDRLFGEGRKAEGVERAKLIIKALETLPQDVVRDFYAPELTLIASADPKGTTGYVKQIEEAEALRQEKARFELFRKNKQFDEAIEAAKAEGAKLKGEDAQRVKLYEIQALADKNDFEQAVKEVEAMRKLAPDSELAKRTERYLSSLKNAKARHEKMEQAAKNPPVKKPSKPIVSKPVAIVTDINALKKEAEEAVVAAAKAVAHEEGLKKANAGAAEGIAALEAELKKLRDGNKKAAEELKKAATDREKLVRRATAMKDVVENHASMEKRKRDVTELEKKAAELQKQAATLRKKAEDLKKGK
jgi:thioredoxin-related protein